jgi:tetratricopeptide (TPR) repeat protein
VSRGSVGRTAVGAAVLMALLASAASAQGALEDGLEALRTGAYDRAVRLLSGAAAAGPVPDRVRAARALAEAHVATGAFADALAALDRVGGSVPPAELAGTRGRVLRRTGRDDEALVAFDHALRAGSSDAIPVRLDRAVLLWERGERREAYEELDRFIDLYNQGRARSVEELTAVGTAVRYLGRRDPALLRDAVRAYEEALTEDPSAHEPRLRMAELFLAAYDAGEARSLLGEVLAVNPRHAGALRRMARARRFDGSAESLQLAERALEVDPASAEGHALLALLRLELGEGDAAIRGATRALETNPRSREALAVRAAAHYFAGDDAAYEADRRRALAVDPLFAGFYTTLGELAVRRGRYPEAVAFAEQGVALDSTAWDARALLGMNQLRLGRVDAARATLERAFEGDPFNVWTNNTLDLVDRLAGFETVRTRRFALVMDPSEAALLAPYAGPVAEEAYDVLSRRYGYRPETPVRVEIYPRHQDFSVRTTGLTGLGALGVAFGNVLAMDSPGARDPGAFHWGSTLWHEIAHAVTLGATGHRIPRWLTEGISVHEERRSRTGWGGRVGPAFLQAFHQDLLLPLREIDAGFVRPTYPGQVGISYQHASLIVEVIERDHGVDGVRRLMRAYADGEGTEGAVAEALGTSPEALDRAVAREVESRFARELRAVASLDIGSHPGAGVAARALGGADLDGLVRAARADRGDFAAQLAAGRALLHAGRPGDAEPFLERADALWPTYTGPDAPLELLATIRRQRGDRQGAVAALRRLTELSESALAANLDLAELLEAEGASDEAAAALERAVYIYPADPEPHDRLARLAVRLGRPDLEVRERRALLALDPVDRAGALYRLAVAHRRAGDLAAARAAVLEALETAPDYAEAQDLLLELAGGDR